MCERRNGILNEQESEREYRNVLIILSRLRAGCSTNSPLLLVPSQTINLLRKDFVLIVWALLAGAIELQGVAREDFSGGDFRGGGKVWHPEGV